MIKQHALKVIRFLFYAHVILSLIRHIYYVMNGMHVAVFINRYTRMKPERIEYGEKLEK